VAALVPFAAAGLVTGIEIVRERSARPAMLAVALAAGVALCRLMVHAPSHIHAEEWSATGYALVHLRESDDAERAFRKSIEEDARWSPAWAGLGVVAANRGDPAGAENFFRKALSLEPDNLAARQELGTLLESRGRFADAEVVYRRAFESAPGDAAFGRDLARTLLAEGRLPEAVTLARELLARNAEDAATHLLLARALGAQHRTRPAALEAAQAARLDPGNGETHFTLAMLSIEAGELDAPRSPPATEALGADPGRSGWPERSSAAPTASSRKPTGFSAGCSRATARLPAAALLLQNARARGKENEALDFLHGLAAPGSPDDSSSVDSAGSSAQAKIHGKRTWRCWTSKRSLTEILLTSRGASVKVFQSSRDSETRVARFCFPRTRSLIP
jgi:tetratricopeptide (TPR) repeat protein